MDFRNTKTEEFNFTIDNCLGFIANRLVKAFLKVLDYKLEDYNLTGAQFCVLTKLFEEEGLTQTQLAHRLYIESPTLVRTLDKLQEAKLIVRKKVPRDRRAFNIFLTKKGKGLKNVLLEKGQEVHEIAVKDLSPEEIGLLKELLFKLWHNLESGALEAKHQKEKMR